MKTFNIYMVLILALALSSCEDYLDVNDSEVDATQEVVTPNLLLAGAITQPHAQFVNSGNELGNIFMNNWAGDINNVTGGFLDEFELDLTPSFRASIWNNIYRTIGTYQDIISYEGDGDYSNHKAIARILKSYYFQYLVDVYGDIPYTEALQGGDNLTPAYDDDQAIYRDLIVQLDLAIAEMNPDAAPVGGEDVVYAGNMDMWVKFANTLKLRILLRESLLPGSSAYVAEQMTALDKNFIGVGESALIDPPYENTAGKQNPFYANYGFDTATPPTPTFDYNFITPSEYAAEFLKGNQTENGVQTGIFDPRVNAIYRVLPEVGEVVGVQQGATNVSAPPLLSELGPGIIVASEQPGYLFTAAESLFLQAEAAQYLGLPGDAQTFFNQGITESFTQLGIGDQAADYITTSANAPKIGWNGPSDKREVIMTQKWIALNSINGLESWIEYTRTGFPDVPLAITATRPAKPNRLLYPSSEYSTNSANVPSQSVDDAFSTKIFWDAN
ncbi:SusD/RagB family nutrient-binding outer membrane lipoprotein [Bizionia sediminis]|uniref:SusD/RagB family nutrient-binding outer membrane lipoprotein n=1 Tax=Bizionia sediminis TaxID=1737064 RepID=A0ABW5KVB6_9FLAO